MKKFLIQFLTVALVLSVTCATALAADELRVNVLRDYRDAVTCTVAGTDRVDLTYAGAVNGRQYLVTAQADGGETAAPTEDNLVYIDQAAASGGRVTFTIYPKELAADQVYSIYLSSNAASTDNGIKEYTQVAKFGINLVNDAPDDVVLGDPSGDGRVMGTDATLVLDFVVGNQEPDERQQLAADVNGDGRIMGTDATLILDFVVGNIDVFPASQGS